MSSVDIDHEEVESEMNMSSLFTSQKDESSSSIEFPLTECDSGKKVTMNSLNEKLMSMWDFLQQQNEKQKKHKLKLSQAMQKQTELTSNFAQTVSQNQDELKQNQDELRQTLVQSLDKHTAKMHETLSIQTKTVYAAIESQNQKIEENFKDQKKRLDADLNSFKEDNTKRLHRLETNVQKINVAFSERDRVLSETNSRMLTITNDHERYKRDKEEINEHIEKLFLTSKAHEQANHQLESKIVRVESASNICEIKCDKIENSLSQMSHTVNEKINELQSNLCKETQNRSKEFCDVNDRLERISDQIKSVREDVEVGTYQPAESWNVRNRKISDCDVEERIESFHDRIHRNRSFSYSGNVPWDLDGDENDDSHDKRCVDNDDVESRFPNHVRFNDCVNDFDSHISCVKESIQKNKSASDCRTFNNEFDRNLSSNDNDQNELTVFAKMMNKIVAKTNNVPLPVFDGVNVDLDSYRRQCMAVARQNEWSSVDLAIRIISSLQGDARSLMNLLPAGQEYDLNSIWNILKSRFDRPFSPELAKNQLANLQQKRGETFLHLSLQVEKLIDRAYPLANEPMRQQLLLDHFIKSIASNAVRYEIRLKNPRDINQAKQMAEEISAIQMSEKFQRLTYVNKISCRGKVDSESSSDEEMEEKKKRKTKVHQKDNEGPCSLSQKHKVMRKDGDARGDDDRKSKIQSVQTGRSNQFSNLSNQNFCRQKSFQNFNLAKNSNRNFRSDGNGEKFQGHYQQSYVQPRQQYYGNGNRRGGQWNSNQQNRRQEEGQREGQRNSRRDDVGSQPRRSRSNWFNRQNLENLYHGSDVRQLKGQRTSRSVSN
jgi:hypothetical protein